MGEDTLNQPKNAAGKPSLQKINDPLLGSADDCLAATQQHGALEQLFVFEKNLYHSIRVVDVVIRIEFEFFKHGIFAYQILDRILESLEDFFQILTARWGLDVKNHLVLNSQFLGDRQGIFRRASVRVMVDHCFGHALLKTCAWPIFKAKL